MFVDAESTCSVSDEAAFGRLNRMEHSKWNRGQASSPASGRPPRHRRAGAAETAVTTVREGHGEYRKKRRDQGRAQRERGPDDRGPGRGQDRIAQHILTIGPNAQIKAQILAKAVVVQGEVHGNVTATDKIEIRDAGSVMGDLSAPRVAIADGAHFRGSIDMQRPGAAAPRAAAKAGGRSASPRRGPTSHPGGPTARPGCRGAATTTEGPFALAGLFKWSVSEAVSSGGPQRGRPRRRPCAAVRCVVRFGDDVQGVSAPAVRARTLPDAGPARPWARRRSERDVLRRAAGVQDPRGGSLCGGRACTRRRAAGRRWRRRSWRV